MDSDFEDDDGSYNHSSSHAQVEHKAISRMAQQHQQAGFRDGKAKHEEFYMQQGFNQGFHNGNDLGRILGKLYAILQQVILRLSREMQTEVQRKQAFKRMEMLRINTTCQDHLQHFLQIVMDEFPNQYADAIRENDEDMIVGRCKTSVQQAYSKVVEVLALFENFHTSLAMPEKGDASVLDGTAVVGGEGVAESIAKWKQELTVTEEDVNRFFTTVHL